MIPAIRALAAVFLMVNASIGLSQTVSQVNGMDWSLPETVGLSPNGRLWQDSGEDSANYIRASFFGLDWKELNPAPGVYDFATIDDEMERAGSTPLIIRINWFGECAAPAWVLSQTDVMSERTIVFWNDAYFQAFSPFIKALGARYSADPRLAGVYIGFGDGQKSGRRCSSDDDGWGEFWMSADELTEAQNNFGLTPALLERATKHLLDLSARAFRGNENKLIFTNIARFYSETESPYNAVLDKLAVHIARLGIGMRNGEIENWSRYIDPVFGQKLAIAPEGTVRLYTDERFARTIGTRYWGDENEFYGNKRYVTAYSGPYRNQGYRFYVSSLRGLQMRYNNMALEADAIRNLPRSPWDPAGLMLYQARVLGRDISNTPDAFTMLGERYVDASYLRGALARSPGIVDGVLRIRGIERWVSEIGDSRAAHRVNMPEREEYWGQYLMPSGVDFEYAARASTVFHFDLNDALARRRCRRTCAVEIKLSYFGDEAATAWIETETGRSESLRLSDDGRLHTASFTINARFANRLARGADFIVHSDGGEMTLLLVRVVFLP